MAKPTIRFGHKLILAKTEAAYGTDPVPVAADAVRTMNLTRTRYDGPQVERVRDRVSMGSYSSLNASPHVGLTFDVELSGMGQAAAAGISPTYTALLQACGLARSEVAAVAAAAVAWATGVDYVVGDRRLRDSRSWICTAAHTSTALNAPDVPGGDAFWDEDPPTPAYTLYKPRDADFESATFYYYEGRNRQVLTGVRGNAEFIFNREEYPMIRFTMMGRYASPTYEAAVVGDISDYVVPFPVGEENTPVFDFAGDDELALSSLSINLGKNVVYRNLVNSRQVKITDRRMTFNMQVEGTTLNEFNLNAAFESHAGTIPYQPMRLLHVPADRQIELVSDGLQVTGISDTNSDEILEWALSGPVTPEGPAAQEFELRYF